MGKSLRSSVALLGFALLAGCGSTNKNDLEHDQAATLGPSEQHEIARVLREKLATFVIPVDVLAAHPDDAHAGVKIEDFVIEGSGRVDPGLLRDRLAETLSDSKKLVVVAEAPLEYAAPKPGPAPGARKVEYVLETRIVRARTEKDDGTEISMTVDMRLVRVPEKTLAFATTQVFLWTRSK
jgi:hypothetical protein